MKRKLTQKQAAFLAFLRGYVQDYGSFPTYTTMQAHLGSPSPNSARQYLVALRKKGYLGYSKHTGYRVLDVCPSCGHKLKEVAV